MQVDIGEKFGKRLRNRPSGGLYPRIAYHEDGRVRAKGPRGSSSQQAAYPCGGVEQRAAAIGHRMAARSEPFIRGERPVSAVRKMSLPGSICNSSARHLQQCGAHPCAEFHLAGVDGDAIVRRHLDPRIQDTDSS